MHRAKAHTGSPHAPCPEKQGQCPRGPGALSWALLCQQRHTWQLPLPHMSPAPQCAALSTFWEAKGLWTDPPGVLTTSQVGTPGRGCGRGWSDRRRGASPWEITILPAHGCLPNSRADGQLSPAAEGPAGREGQCGSGHSLAWPQESGAPTPADPALPLEQNKPVAESQAPQLEGLTLLGSSCSGGPSALQPPIHPLRPGPPTPGQGTVGQQVAPQPHSPQPLSSPQPPDPAPGSASGGSAGLGLGWHCLRPLRPGARAWSKAPMPHCPPRSLLTKPWEECRGRRGHRVREDTGQGPAARG